MNVTIHSALATDCLHCHLPHRHMIRNKIDCDHIWFCCIRAMQRGGEVLSVVYGCRSQRIIWASIVIRASAYHSIIQDDVDLTQLILWDPTV